MAQCTAEDSRIAGYSENRSSATKRAGISTKWYHTAGGMIVALACVGPFALPVAWANPRLRPVTKSIVTVLVLVLTVLVCYIGYRLVLYIIRQYQMLLS